MYRILCIEDSPEVLTVIRRVLASTCEVVFSTTLEEARKLLAQGSFDLVTLDIGLPDGDGLRFCSELKSIPELSKLPVFVLTANHSLQEKTLGFQLGIEDFIVKPFEPLELKLRIESRLKKLQQQKRASDVMSAGLLRINLSLQRATLQLPEGPLSLELSTTEFKILSYLVRNREQVKSREQIITAIWGEGLHLSDRTVDSHISRIRKKLKSCDCVIEAVQNSGYRFLLKHQEKAA